MGFDNASLARRYLTEVWGKGNLAVADELVDDKVKISDPLSEKPAESLAAFKERIEMMSKEFTDNLLTIEELVSAGDIVVVRDRWTGVCAKDFFGVPGSKGKRLTCDAVEWIRIKNGKVVENITYFDAYTLFQQLGALPPPAQFTGKAPETAAKTARA